MATPVKPPTKSVSLYVGGDLDLFEEYERLQAAQLAPKTMAGTDRARLDEVEAEIRAGMMRFRFRALGRRSLQKLMDAYPPRKDKTRDQMLGFNEDEATAALIRKCLVEPELSDEAVNELIEDQLTDGQYDRLADTAWALNRRSADIPFSLAGSTSRPPSAAG